MAVSGDDFSHSALPWGITGPFDWPASVDEWWLNRGAGAIDDNAIVFLCVRKP